MDDKEAAASPTRSTLNSKMSARYIMAILGSFGMGIIYGLKVNLHVAIVSMVNHTALQGVESLSHDQGAINTGETCFADEAGNSTTTVTEDGPFEWPSTVQGILLSAYFWGYLISQLPGGRVAELFSAKLVMFFAVAINIVCTLLTPVMAKLHYGALIVMRFGEGIGGGVTFPAMHVMLAHWAPPTERSVMSSIVYAGTALGTVVMTLVSGMIADDLGWEYIFYIEGGVSALWLILWLLLIADSPQKHRFISQQERDLIENALNQESGGEKRTEHPKMPWKTVLTSPAFLAILIAHTCSNWGWYMVLIELPTYMKNVLNFKISSNATLSSIPFLCMWFFSMILSKTLDTLLTKKKITTTTARKTATLIASVIPLVCFIAVSYIGCQRYVAVVLMTIAVTSIGGMFCGFLSNHIDIAPNFAGTLMAITNTVATIPGIVVPIFVGKLIDSDPTIRSWRIIFWTTVALYIVEIVVYTVFGSGQVQPWNQIEPNPENVEQQPLKSPSKNEEKQYNTTEPK